MVLLEQVQRSNDQIKTSFNSPSSPLVAVFVGATSGIGEYTLRSFARRTTSPKVYFVGRSAEAGQRIKDECQRLNPQGEFVFVKSDISLLRNVDDVCKRIKEEVEDQGKGVNLVVVSQGTLARGIDTSEGIHLPASLIHHSRIRFIQNLLPLLQTATGLRRVVSVFTGTKEGPLDSSRDVSDIEIRNVPLMKARGHAASNHTLALESLAQKAPEVGFVHVFPGFVKSGIAREMTGVLGTVVRVLGAVVGPFKNMDPDECGERHLFLATSARYPGKKGADGGNNGVDLIPGVEVAVATDGVVGGGVYSVDEFGESAGKPVQDVLAGLRKEGVGEKQWEVTMKDFKRICETERI